MQRIELSAGPLEYEDTGGNGPLLLFLHGLAMDSSLWRHVIAELRSEYRCLAPVLPLGSHRFPMNADADLSANGLAHLVLEFAKALHLTNITLVGNDWGGAQLVAAQDTRHRIARLVLTSQEAFTNIPPGLPGRALWLSTCLPGGIYATMQSMRLRFLRRSPMAFGWMSKRPIPNEIMDAWLSPLITQRQIRQDLEKYLRTTTAASFLAASEQLRTFTRPSLVIWATEDRVMPLAHGRQLADLLPASRLIEIPDSYTLIPEDQPLLLASHIREFMSKVQ